MAQNYRKTSKSHFGGLTIVPHVAKLSQVLKIDVIKIYSELSGIGTV